MLRDFLLIVIGLACATIAPHIALLINHWRSGNEAGLMNELYLSWPVYVIEAILILIVGTILYFVDKRKEKKDDDRLENILNKVLSNNKNNNGIGKEPIINNQIKQKSIKGKHRGH
jgi:hypothetical protein